jgi:hypothetical protein
MKIKCLLKPNFLRVQSFPECCKSMQLVTRQLEKAPGLTNITRTVLSVVNKEQTGSTRLREAAVDLLGDQAVAAGRESKLVFNAGKALRTFQGRMFEKSAVIRGDDLAIRKSKMTRAAIPKNFGKMIKKIIF